MSRQGRIDERGGNFCGETLLGHACTAKIHRSTQVNQEHQGEDFFLIIPVDEGDISPPTRCSRPVNFPNRLSVSILSDLIKL